jgi:hypothetical protein
VEGRSLSRSCVFELRQPLAATPAASLVRPDSDSPLGSGRNLYRRALLAETGGTAAACEPAV